MHGTTGKHCGQSDFTSRFLRKFSCTIWMKTLIGRSDAWILCEWVHLGYYYRRTLLGCFGTWFWSWIRKVHIHSRCSGFRWSSSDFHCLVRCFYDVAILIWTCNVWRRMVLFVRMRSCMGKLFLSSQIDSMAVSTTSAEASSISYSTTSDSITTEPELVREVPIFTKITASGSGFYFECWIVHAWVGFKCLRKIFPRQ